MHASWDDRDLVTISALEHWAYCPRQCALIHLEQTFDENVYTLRGRLLHEKVDLPGGETVRGVRVERALPLWSDRLGLVGKADAVEFHGPTPFPVEYKVGRRRSGGAAVLQLCAQAMCLEEMTGQAVPRGAVYYHASRRRREVGLTPAMRARVEQTVLSVRTMMQRHTLPPAPNDARCRHCSLRESCLPAVCDETARIRAVCDGLFLLTDDAP